MISNTIPFRFPALELPDELLCKVASFLDVTTLSHARSVSRKFKALMSTNEAGWLLHCQQLWNQRLHVSLFARRIVTANCSTFPARDAYILSCMDSRRDEMTMDELCYDCHHGQGTVWTFRFKEAAGLEWTAFDPWHNGGEARRMIFLRDGRVQQIAENGELQLPFSDALDARGVEVRWRKVQSPLIDGAQSDGGDDVVYIRLHVAGRDIPTYVVRRHRSNWGFLMENCWGVFASFPLPRKLAKAAFATRSNPTADWNYRADFGDGGDGDHDNNNNIRHVNMQTTSTFRTSHNNPAAAAAAATLLSTHQPLYRPTKRRKPNATAALEPLSDDTNLVITGRLQWREALLYNLGANTLPDGPGAAVDFYRAWQELIAFLQENAHRR